MKHIDKNGDTCLYIASLYGFDDCVDVLKTYGCTFSEQKSGKRIKFDLKSQATYPLIVRATVDKLISYLTNSKFSGIFMRFTLLYSSLISYSIFICIDLSFWDTFFSTFTRFTDAEYLLKAFTRRYKSEIKHKTEYPITEAEQTRKPIKPIPGFYFL